MENLINLIHRHVGGCGPSSECWELLLRREGGREWGERGGSVVRDF